MGGLVLGGFGVGFLAVLVAFGVTTLGFGLALYTAMLRTILFMPAYWWVLPDLFPSMPQLGFWSVYALFLAGQAVMSVINPKDINTDNNTNNSSDK